MVKTYQKPFIIAEAGCNHMGQMRIAKQLIEIAASFCKADAIKFQKRCPRELLTPEQYNSPHPNPKNSYGKTYGEHREFLEFTATQHQQLKDWCDEFGIIYSTSVWDMTSAKEIAAINPKFIKIPSACNNHYEMLQWLCDNYDGEIQLSFGMTTYEEERNIVELFEKNGRNKDLVIFACTSGYPVPYEDVCLLELNRLYDTFGNTVKKIGFSGHHIGTAIDIAAYALGATVIERHYTLDKTWKGTDHAASLEPEEFKILVRDLNRVSMAMTAKPEEILPIEKIQRDKLKYRCR
ncbi:N-acetylneuraminate synthase [Candidatus Methanomethylophilus alvi Mx1201]|uniref:N-acetylneuraminate synthase n=2 Tax=Methanomethylophilus alvi TaxID=1291540 RepID=M9SGF7_METAX|nr:N-acetylneuraminate synthase family protein [Methanomethylophilus alvi]AGI85278.1 N-acetylneuraminate synthase [Candidatus Methanomethylophilus alvi Mx1201]AYQ54702.1 N-acetylneuraminate synthase [Methanomethylophilus alvi]